MLKANETHVPSERSILSLFPNIRVILFDLGGTLWKPFGDNSFDEIMDIAVFRMVGEVDRCTGGQVSSKGSKEFLMSRFGRTRADLLREIDFYKVISECLSFQNVEFTNRQLKQIADAFGDALSGLCIIYPETISVLSWLKDAGYIMGIVSNTSIPPHIIDRYLVKAEIMEKVDFRVLSSVVGWRKPHKKIYQEALNLAGVAPEKVLFVGDRLLEDGTGPRVLGMKSVVCRNHGLPCELSPKDRPDAFVKDLQELI